MRVQFVWQQALGTEPIGAPSPWIGNYPTPTSCPIMSFNLDVCLDLLIAPVKDRLDTTVC